MRVLQWNIGGARIREGTANALDTESYAIESIEYLAQLAMGFDPDIITLQETHQGTDGNNQARDLADALGFGYFINDTHDESHIEKGQMYGQAILSKLPLVGHNFKRLPNPSLSVKAEDGQVVHAHNYGITTADIEFNNSTVRIQTLHLPALHFFEVRPDTQKAKQIIGEVTAAIQQPVHPTIIAGDFNLDCVSVLDLVPELAAKGFGERPTDLATTPSGRRLDRFLYHGFKSVGLAVVASALTDHYPIIGDFEIAL